MSDQPELPGIPEPPPFVQLAQWAWHHLRLNKDAFLKGPVLVALAIAGLIGWWFGNGHNEEELRIAEQRISFLGDQVAAYKERLQGATPDQAAKEIAALKGELDKANGKLQLLLPDTRRLLTESQKKYIQDHKIDFSKYLNGLRVYAWETGDSLEYAEDFVNQFKKIIPSVIGPMEVPCDNSQRGVIVGLRDANNPSDDSKGFTSLLSAMGLNVTHTKWESDAQSPDFDLFICGDTTNPPAASPPSPVPPK
jgi:hypothetical protein